MKTINQIIDKISQIKLSAMTTEIGEFRQKLIDLKKGHPKGGLIVPTGSDVMKYKINQALGHRTESFKNLV